MRPAQITHIHASTDFNEILKHPLFLSMSEYRHHGDVSCLDHTMFVANLVFSIAKSLGLDYRSATRAALLHDFYLYDWHTDSPGLHGFKHPGIALKNAEQHFYLNPIERDAIIRHMWPLTPIPPRYPESYLVSLADKYASLTEYCAQVCNQIGSLFKKCSSLASRAISL